MRPDLRVETCLGKFSKWFRSNGGHVHPDVEFAYDDDRGVHCRAKALRNAVIAPNTLVVFCPHALTLSALNPLGLRLAGGKGADSNGTELHVRDGFAASALPEELLKNARPQCIAAFELCVQWSLREDSFWYPYLCVLPKPPAAADRAAALEEGRAKSNAGQNEIDIPLWWEEEERAWFKGTNLERGMEDLESVWKSEWDRWSPVIEDWAAGMGYAIDWHLFKWAVSILGSRAFSSVRIETAALASGGPVLGKCDPHALLYPGCDALNHSAVTKNREYHDSRGFGIVCNDCTKPGEEIWGTYGPKSNAELLLSFGFSLVYNPHDRFALRLSASTNATSQPDYSQCCPSNSENGSATGRVLETHPGGRRKSQAPAYNLEKATYFIRVSSPWTEDQPEYADDTHLYGFPQLLVSKLAVTIANAREAAAAAGAVQSRRASASSHQQYGLRNELAVTNLLLSRLRVELRKVTKAQCLVTRADASSSQRGELFAERRAQRRRFAAVYLEGQKEILQSNLALLERRMADAFLPGHRHFTPTQLAQQLASDQGPAHTELLTLPAALCFLRVLSRSAYDDFVAGIRAGFRTDSFSVLRAEGLEEEVWTLWLGAVFILLQTAEVWQLFPAQRHARSMLQTHFAFFMQNYSAAALAAARGGELGAAEKSMMAHVADVLAAVKSSCAGMPIWSLWTRSLLRSCVVIVLEETLCVTLAGADYDAIRRTELRLLEQRDETPPDVEGELAHAPADEAVPIVGLYVGVGEYS